MTTKEQFILKIKDGAILGYKKYGVLPSLTLAQAILESGWGKSDIGNNLFGIKAGKSWKGKTKEVKTQEYYSQETYEKYLKSGKKMQLIEKVGDKMHVLIFDVFRVYDTIDESVADHALLLTAPRYAKVISAKNYQEGCLQLQKCGYATDINYPQKLIGIIEQNNLDRWDKMEETWVTILKNAKLQNTDEWIKAISEQKDGLLSLLPSLIVKVANGDLWKQILVGSGLAQGADWVNLINECKKRNDIFKDIDSLIVKIATM